MAMEPLQALMARITDSATTFEQLSPKEWEQLKVDDMNNAEGSEHERDGYHCGICRNKGQIFFVKEPRQGYYITSARECQCAEIRRSIHRMKRSGLKDIIKDYTFDKFEATEAWQEKLKAAAMEYAHNPEGWFFLGGQSGCGKTHLCTAICREFLLGGRRVVYMLWRDDIAKLKSLAVEMECRMEMIERFKQADVLYIDDLFKTGKNSDGSDQRPTSADINAAFEIINYRYCNPNLLTIVSSEWTVEDLLDIDEATGSRIYERADKQKKAYSIGKDRSRNYRTRGAVTL